MENTSKQILHTLNQSQINLEENTYLENSPKTIFENVPNEIYEEILNSKSFNISSNSVEDLNEIFEAELKEQQNL